jgi:hypothetical protein
MATTVDPNTDSLGDDDESVHASREPVQTPGTNRKYFSTDMEEELHDEIKKLHTVLRKVGNFLRVQHPNLLLTMEKMSIFDEPASDPDMEPGGSHPTSTWTSTARNASGTPLYKTAYVNLNDDLQAESEQKPAAWREEQSERESSLRTDTSTEAGYTKEGPAMGDSQILKNKSNSVKFQKDATNLKFPSGNQVEGDSIIISKSDAEKRAILQLSEENSRKLLLLASALENIDTSKKMSECKLQKRLFVSAKQLKLKEFKYDANPSVH